MKNLLYVPFLLGPVKKGRRPRKVKLLIWRPPRVDGEINFLSSFLWAVTNFRNFSKKTIKYCFLFNV